MSDTISIPQIRDLFQVAQPTLDVLIKRGDFPAPSLELPGGYRLFNRAEIAAWLHNSTKRPGEDLIQLAALTRLTYDPPRKDTMGSRPRCNDDELDVSDDWYSVEQPLENFDEDDEAAKWLAAHSNN